MSEKPKSIRTIRRLRKKEPKLVEGVKQTLFLRGNKPSHKASALMKDLRSLRREHSAMFSRKHDIHPFESRDGVESLCKKKEASLFMFGSHSKKRPNNIVIGRTYEHKVLDMVELGVINFESMEEIVSNIQVPSHLQPFVVFQGDLWEANADFKKLKNLINDFFCMNKRTEGVEIDKAMKVVICWSVTEDQRIFLNVFEVNVEGGSAILQEEGKLVIEELGPNATFALRRSSWADEETYKKSIYIPKPSKKKVKKNVKTDAMGNTRGKLYLDRQNLKAMPTRRRKIISKRGQKRESGEIIGHTKNEDEFAQ